MRIGIVCYPTFGGSGVIATELGKGLAQKGHKVHFITYKEPARLLDTFNENIFFHEVSLNDYPLFDYAPYETALASKLVDVAIKEKLDIFSCTLCHSTCFGGVYGECKFYYKKA